MNYNRPYLYAEQMHGNCGIQTITGFEQSIYWNEPLVRKINWIKKLGYSEIIRGIRQCGIVAFTGVSEWDHIGTPVDFANWLKEQGEKVVESEATINPNTKHLIKGWYWIPSKAIRGRINAVRRTKKRGKAKLAA